MLWFMVYDWQCLSFLSQRDYNQTNTQSPHRAEARNPHTQTHHTWLHCTHLHTEIHLNTSSLTHTGTPTISHSSKNIPATFNCNSCFHIPQTPYTHSLYAAYIVDNPFVLLYDTMQPLFPWLCLESTHYIPFCFGFIINTLCLFIFTQSMVSFIWAVRQGCQWLLSISIWLAQDDSFAMVYRHAHKLTHTHTHT